MQIIPAIIPKSEKEIEDRALHILGTAMAMQVDVVDSLYTNDVSWPYNTSAPADIIEAGYVFPDKDNILYEMDMMTRSGESDLEVYYNMGANRFIFHTTAESLESAKEFIEAIDIELRDVIEIGIALHHDQGMDVLDRFVNIIDFVQVMGISDIGEQGHQFDPITFEICKAIKAKYPLTIVSVDGGIKEHHLEELKACGVDRAVMNSAFWESGDQLGLLNRYS